MKTFPVIKENQFVLVRAYYDSGIILDENLNVVISDEQNCYTIFNSMNEVIDYAKALVNQRGDIECNIYNSSDKPILCIDINNYNKI